MPGLHPWRQWAWARSRAAGATSRAAAFQPLWRSALQGERNSGAPVQLTVALPPCPVSSVPSPWDWA